jgi:hypothetical protein
MPAAASSRSSRSTAKQRLNGVAVSDRMSGRELATVRRRVERLDVFESAETKEFLRVQGRTMEDFRQRWLLDLRDTKSVMKRARALIQDNDFCDYVFRMKMQFFNAGFEIYSSEKLDATQRFLRSAADYPFANLSRDVWTDYLATSNVVAVWLSRDRATPEQLVNGIPLVTVMNAEDVEFNNEFGVESLKIRLKQRKLTEAEKRRLGPRYARAIEEGGLLELSREDGENWKVLTSTKLGGGFGMPSWKSVLDDLATRDLMKIGDFIGAGARKQLIRHGQKGHKITDGPLAGMPEYFYRPSYGKKIIKAIQDRKGLLDLMSNFDLVFAYVFLDPKFFDATVFKAVEDRLAKWAGACVLMLREGNPNPNLSKAFQAEGFAERDVVGRFLASILNDRSFLPESLPRGLPRLKVRWDPWVFFDAEQLRQMITFGLQNGLMPPQTAQRALRLDPEEQAQLMREARKNREDHTPVFEAKQGMGLAAATNDGGDAGALGGRPPTGGGAE